MITNVFKTLMSMVLQSTGSSTLKSLLPILATNGATKYIGGKFDSFPHTTAQTVRIQSDTYNAGIWIGSGDTQESESDYTLSNRITSGLTATQTTLETDLDANGNPYIAFTFMLTNTTASDIVVKEIGYVQRISVAETQGVTSYNTNYSFLLDRTVFDTPITVAANDSAAIKYTLKTVLPI